MTEARDSLADYAYLQVRARILDGRIAPGSPLSVPALARELEISRSPVREAVQRLIHEELATHALNKGAVVTRLAPDDLIEIYTVKEPLSGLAARLAATRLTQADVDELQAMMAAQERALTDAAAVGEFMALDVAFHSFVDNASGNRTLAETLGRFTTKTHMAVPAAWTNEDYARRSVAEHRALTEALISGDPDAAEHAARAHIRNVCVRLTRWHEAVLSGTPPVADLRDRSA